MKTSNSNTFIHALIGAAVTFVLSFSGISPILGGAIAGYLEKKDGWYIGAISGAMATVPILLAVLFVGFVIAGFLTAIAEGMAGILVVLAFLGMVLFVAGFVIALSALGGFLGVKMREDLG